MYKKLIEKIKEFDTIVIARHVGVDLDALCSQLALRDSIRLTYPDKKVCAIGTGSAKYVHIGKLEKKETYENALLIVTDTPDKKRVDSADFSMFKYVIKIDHHPFIEKYADLEIIEDNCGSVCEVIMNIIKETELKCDSTISELLFMGLVADTNRFLFGNSFKDTFNLVAYYLDKYPFDLKEAYAKMYLRPLKEVRLEGYIALNMKVTKNGLGYIVITNEIINEFGVDSASAGNMINNFNYIADFAVWATITEDVKNDQYRVSIRSRGPEINGIAEKHNGGGHKFAAGARVKTLNEAKEIIKDLDNRLEVYNEKISEGK